MRIEYIIVIFQLIINLIKCEYVEGCEVGNYCGSIPCSIYGFCNYNLSHYYNDTISEDGSQHQLICQCYLGYSSYDIDVQHNNNSLHCCYKKKSHLTAFYLEFFIGFGIGHFFIGNINFGLIKFFVQIFFCMISWCTLYHSCQKNHTIVVNLNDMNRKESLDDIKKIKEKNDINEIKEVNEEEDENIIEEEKSENINNESKNQSFSEDNEDNEENKINQLLSENLIQCPISKFFIILSAACYFLFHIGDLFVLGFGLHKDKNGEDLNLWN